MRLKKMEITGFKSFVERVAIDFPAGVSAIVGPNGCGKSNIVDALRWAMGEQSVKQLRGKSMEDVIFAGTDGRPPLNMAEVSLVLANENGSGPEALKDFTEVMITRRLYRSGESAYLLNRHPCRLKDIQNLFLGSGLGAKSYAVIGQGNIGAITDAGPEERRFFIEEAAGITRYKSRKTETLRKLEATSANLDRVNDIIAEVARQMNGRQRQAKKAERYKTLQARIRVLDLNLSIREHDQLTEEIREAEGDLRKLKDQEAGRGAAIRRLEADIEGVKLTRYQKNQEIAKRKSDRFETQRSIDKAENDLAHLREEIGRLAEEIGDLTGGREGLEEKNRSMDAEIGQVSGETERLEKAAAALRSDVDGEETAVRDLKKSLADAERLLTERKTARDTLLQQETRHRAALDHALQNKESLERRRKRADEAVLLAGRDTTEKERQDASARAELADCREAVQELDHRLAGLEEDLETRRGELARQSRRVRELEQERETLRSRYGALKKMADTYEWYREGVKAVMTRGEGRPPDGVLGLTADILEPDPGYETAVEAVLGETLQYVLVETPEAGADAVDYLRWEKKGRAGFIPVSSVRPMAAGTAPGEGDSAKAGAPSPLLDHVRIREGYEAIGRSLLGHVLVTDHLSDALAVAGTGEPGQAVATRGGDVITPQNILLGGSPETLAGILAKKQELKHLAEEIDGLKARLETEAENRAALEEILTGLTEERRVLSEERQGAVADELAAQKSVYAAAEALKQARRHQETVKEEAARLLDEAGELDGTVATSREALTSLTEKVAAATAEADRQEAAVSDLSDRLSAMNDRTVDRRMQLTALNGQLENSRNTLNRLREFRKESLARLEQLKRDIDIKEKRRREAEERIEAETRRLGVMYANLDHLTEALEKSEAEFTAIDADLKKKEASLTEARQDREAIQGHLRSAEMAQSQRRMKADNIVSRLAERYHGDIAELRAEMAESGAMAEAADGEAMARELAECRKKIAAIGDVNMGAIREYAELKERHEFLLGQQSDLVEAVDDLHQVIRKINKISQEKFLATFDQVNEKLNEVFPRLFDGGTARLELTEPEKPLETGVEFMVHPPGKKLTRLSLLSGGEKALAAIAFVFSIFLIKPASFCIMDEIDAPLDEANVYRFNDLLRIIGEQSQIVMITHKKKSMEFADTLLGITMEKKGISKVVSVNLEGR